MAEQESQQAASQDAALSIRFEVKPFGTRALLRRQDVQQARVVVRRLIQASTPYVGLILRQCIGGGWAAPDSIAATHS
jgi:hypothetical protein